MKKPAAVLAALAVSFALAACGDGGEETDSDAPDTENSSGAADSVDENQELDDGSSGDEDEAVDEDEEAAADSESNAEESEEE